jgi:predicted aldo/keto reductase-like oxidoreductase
MQYRRMGSLPWKVSALGFGCMRLPSKKFLIWKKVDQPEAIKIIRYGIDQGINYIDTAFVYHLGQSEVIVGHALKDGYREKVHLVTKLPMWIVRKPEDVEHYLKIQLKRLQTDHLDIYLFHGLNRNRFDQVKKLGLIKEMERMKAKGLIHAIGFSFHDSFSVFKEIIDYYKWDMAQVQYNYMDTALQATTEGLKYAAAKGIAVVIMEPLRGGKLATPTADVQKLMDCCGIKRTPVDWALQFLWNIPEISVVLSGMGSLQMVQENVTSADKSGIKSLTPVESQTLQQIADVFRKQIVIPCTGCDYCQPCHNGVKVPQTFAMINRLGQNKDLKQAQKEYKQIMKENGGPDKCDECRQCVDKCPQQIDVPEMLKIIAKVMENRELIAEQFK